MIQLPRRSVTRFFIPLIDVLTLLFCIFLLMPLVKDPEGGEAAGETRSAPRLGTELAGLSPDEAVRRVREAQRELDQLRKERIETLQQRLAIQVLEIDPANGKLFYFDPERVAIASAADAQKLIDRRKREIADKELYFLILFPRQVTGYPEEGQVRRYDRWFAGVAHGIDNPHAH